MLRIDACLVALALCLPVAVARAQAAPIGYIKIHAGDATVLSSGRQLAAAAGLALHQGDTLRTGNDGRLGLTLLDDTVMSLGPNAEMVVDEYLFSPGEQQLGLGVRLARGTLQFISGAIARLRPEAVRVRTSTGTIGVRGTRFLVQAGE